MMTEDKKLVVIFCRYEFSKKSPAKIEKHTKKLLNFKERLEKTFKDLAFVVTSSKDVAKRVYEKNVDRMFAVIAVEPRFFGLVVDEANCPCVSIKPERFTIDELTKEILKLQ